MNAEVLMPRLSDSMEQGTVVEWLKRVGDSIAVGDPLLSVETDKATVVYEAETAGVLLEIRVREGETAPLGAVLARIGDRLANGVPHARGPARIRIKATPVARRLALALDVDLEDVSGSGPNGRVVRADVDHAARRARATAVAERDPSQGPMPPTGARDGVDIAAGVDRAKGNVEVTAPTRPQETIARRMSESSATIPDFILYADIDMTAAVGLRSEFNRHAEVPITYNDMILKAAALALREHPRANGAYKDGRFESYSRINVGVAVATDTALVVPTIFDADRKSLGEIARESRHLAEAVREGTITPAQLAGGTFTISNLGMHGVSAFGAIINPGQAAILSVGAITKRPVVAADGEIAVRDLVTLGLTCDHRVLYGADAAAFLRRIDELLTQPLSMAL
jgi:pyruvate dehydrogenase E2 component (dihydrolipoamide acetyltransferase)